MKDYHNTLWAVSSLYLSVILCDRHLYGNKMLGVGKPPLSFCCTLIYKLKISIYPKSAFRKWTLSQIRKAEFIRALQCNWCAVRTGPCALGITLVYGIGSCFITLLYRHILAQTIGIYLTHAMYKRQDSASYHKEKQIRRLSQDHVRRT